jgi:predicted porin
MTPFKFTAVPLAAAILLASASAHAQSSVTISGTIDIGMYRDLDHTTHLGPISRSNIAFSGVEDLGGGLAATFKLSHRFDPSNGGNESGTKPFWHGESTVGLKGGWGSIKFGRALDAISANDWEFDPWYNFDRIASPAWDLWHYNFPSDPKANSGTAEYGRLNNGIFYDSPTFGGFQLHLSGSPQSEAGEPDKALGGSLHYKNQYFSGMVAHERNAAGNTDNFLGLKSGFGSFGIMGVYDVSKAGASKAKTTTLGATYAISNVTLQAGWGQVNLDGVKAEKMFSLGAVYALSKRTNVYADFAHKTFVASSGNTYGVGIAHSF